MDLPAPPDPSQLADAGIPIDAPPPPELGSDLSDDQLRDIAKGKNDPYAHLSDEHLKAIALGADPDKYAHMSDKELAKLAGTDSGGLESNRPVQTTGSGVGDAVGAFTHGMNAQHRVPGTDLDLSWNPFISAADIGAYGMNKALTATGVQPMDNESFHDLSQDAIPNPEATGVNQAMDSAGNMAMSVPAAGAIAGATPILKGAAAAKYIPWAEPATGFLGKTGQYASNAARAVPRTGQALLKGAISPAGAGASGAAAYTAGNAGAGFGQDVARQVTKDDPGYISLPAQMLGAMTPAGISTYVTHAPSRYAGRAIKGVWDDVTGKTEDAIASGSADSVLDQFKPPKGLVNQFSGLQGADAAQGLADAQQLRAKMPGFNPTLGEATGLQSALTQQASLEGNKGGTILDNYVDRKAVSEQGIADFAANAGPQRGQTVYHGGNFDAATADKSKMPYFTTDPEEAETYAEANNGTVTKHTLDIKNPASTETVMQYAKRLGMLDEDGEAVDGIPATVFDKSVSDPAKVDKLVARLKKQGYDGATIADMHMGDDTESHIPFSHDQIDPVATPRGDAAAIDRAAKARVTGVQQPIQHQLTSIQTGREGLASAIPEAKAYDTGNYLRDRLEALRTAKQDEMTKLAETSGLTDATKLPVSRDALQTAVKNARDSQLFGANSPTMRKIAALKPDTPLSFGDAKAAMEDLGAEARDAAKTNPKAANTLSNVRGNIDKYLQDEWAPGLGLGDNYKQFRQTYKNEYIDRFETGDAKTVGAQGGGPNYRTDNENVASKFWAPGDVTSAINFHRTFGGDPGAMEAMQAHILDDARGAAVDPKTGVIDPAKMDKWMSNNKNNLAQFPGIEANLKNVTKQNAALTDRMATLNSRQQAVEDTQLAKSVGTGKAYDTMMQNPALLKRTVASMNDGQKSAMARRMWTDAAQHFDNPDNLGSFLKDNGDQLSTVMSPQHVDNLNDIHKALTMNARSSYPTGSAVITSPLEHLTEAAGVSPKGVLSLGRAMARHMMSPEYVAADLFTRMGIATSNVSAKKMIEKAVYDPAFADKLSKFMSAPSKAKAEGFRPYMLRAGIKGVENENEEDDNGH